MSENTSTVDTTVSDDKETKVDDLALLTVPRNIEDETAKLLLQRLYDLNNKTRALVREHREHDKGDDLAATLISDAKEFEGETDDEFILAVQRLAKMEARVAEEREAIKTLANARAAEMSDDDFDADKSRTNIRAVRADGMAAYKTTLSVFEMTGRVSVTKSPTGNVEDVEAVDAIGQALIDASFFPNVRATKGGSSSGGNSDTAKVRAWAQSVAEERGWTIGDKGRINADVIEAYNEAHSE